MTTLIKNIQLIDGTGRAPFKADVLLKRKKISAIGNFPRYKAQETIDGRGAYLAPGFIDIHSSLDRYLKIFSDHNEDDSFVNLLRNGVTTIIGGQDGISLAPIIYGTLAPLREWIDIKKINVGWHTVKEFLKILSKRALPFNFGTLAGYETIRRSIATDDSSRSLSQNEIRVIKSLIERSLKEGAFGVSFGNHNHSLDISKEEMKSVLAVVSKLKAVSAMELYGTGEEILTSLQRIINLAAETGAKIILNHIDSSGHSQYEKILEMIDANSSRADVCFEIYPQETNIFPAYKLLPSWSINAQSKSARIESIVNQLKNPIVKAKILKDLPRLKGEDILIISAPHHEYLEGQNLKEYSQNRGLTVFTGFLDLIQTTGSRVIISYKTGPPKDLAKRLNRKKSIISSFDSHEKDVSEKSFARFFETVIRENLMPIEALIHKMTGFPAAKLGLLDRGVIRAGYFADLILFRDAEIKEVILNGSRVVEDGKFKDILAGEVLAKTF